MKQKFSALVILILALGMGTMSPRTQSRVDIPPPLADRVAAGETVSVIVGVGARFVPEGDLPAAADVAAQRASTAQALDDTMARAAGVGVTVGGKFERIPFFTARVNRAQLEALATTAGVTSINEDGLLKPTLATSTTMVNAPAAWAAGHTGAGWTVAVLDTGVESSHGFLTGRVTREACYSDNNGLGSGTSLCPGGAGSATGPGTGAACSSSISGCDHGTHVAGIAAGANAPGGVNGVAPGSAVMAVQVFTRFDGAAACGSGNPTPCTSAFTSDIIRGLERVLVEAGAGNVNRIAAVNMSLGGGAFDTEASCDAANVATKAAIDNLRSVGIASVIASGNDAFADALAAPACISTAVAVGATTKGICTGPGSPPNIGCPNNAVPGQISVPGFSNVAPFLDLYAPGSFIQSSELGNTYDFKSGTSMAAPHVAGAWAILKQAVPAASVTSVLAAFTGTGTPITEPFTGFIHPMINVNNARVALLGGGGGGGVPGAPTGFAVNASGNTLNMTWVPPASGGAPTNYNLIARVVSGGAPVVVLPLGNVTSFGVAAPNGVFFLSVQASNASGPGPESNVVPVTVPSLPPPPGAPSNLQANVTGNTVVFTFTPPASGGAVTNFVLLAGQTPGFVAPLATLPLAPTQTSVAIPGVPPGLWYVRVVAQNAGGTSAPTNEVAFTVAGPQPPGTPTMNAPTVTAGNTVNLSWTPGAGGAPSSYNLVVRLSPAGPVFAQLPLSVTSVSFPGVPSGTYYLEVIANNALGSSGLSNQVTLVVP